MNQHITAQKHIKLFNAREERRRIEAKCGLFVRGYPPNLRQEIIYNYFSHFGKIVWGHFGNSYFLLDYSHPSMALNVLKGNHYLAGSRLTIRYRELNSQDTSNKVPQVENCDGFYEELKNINKFNDQVQHLMDYLAVGDSRQFPWYHQVCQDLYDSLIYNFPRVKIHPFGSTITGLDFKNSDIDVYIDGVRTSDNNVSSLYRIKNCMLNSLKFTNCIVIGRAKIPIMKCIHIASNLNCDVNVKNMLGVCNSQLINYYLDLVVNIRKAMIVIKYWAKVHKISGQNNLFTNYSLGLLMIFHLQQPPHRVPSVLSLQQSPKCANIHDGWNGGFEQKLLNIRTLKELTLAKLLAGFFEFYSNFDYNTNVICPYLGKPVKKSDFKSPDQLPNYYRVYKEFVKTEGNLPLKADASICIQDPLEHSRNVTPIVSDAILNTFVSFCCHAKQICKDVEKNMLFKLLSEEPPNMKADLLLKSQLVQFAIQMGDNVKYLEKTVEGSIRDRKEALKRAWFDSVDKFLMMALKDFLNFNVEETTEEVSNNKAKKKEGQADIHDRKEAVRSYKCSTMVNLWASRKSASTNVAKDVTVIDREWAVTKQILLSNKEVVRANKIIELEMTLRQKTDPVQVLVDLTKLYSRKKTFNTFSKFFTNEFPSWFEAYEQEANASA
ncbi:hypothetical protein JTB14_008257 [Gonioctena quinquepunctata]|nr:hypothetical protein JTB14_008257 [Gonioctena quinquepunctata]